MRRALIVGIDQYPNGSLQGCVEDAIRMERVLSRHSDGGRNFDCRVLTAPSDTITRSILREAVTELFRSPADIAFFHFSGHGTANNLGGYLVTPDATRYDEGVPMADVLVLANQSSVQEVVITLDCCHSGVFGALPEIRNERAVVREGVSVITASRGDQESLEIGGGGLFTSLLTEALEGGAAGILGDVTAAGCYAYVDNALGAWDQRPLFKSHVSKFVTLRSCTPKVSPDILRQLPVYFPLPAEQLQLDPGYEPQAEPHDEAKEEQFSRLQKLRAAGLVEPVGEEHMYYATMHCKSCRLTALGRYYWRLVNNSRI